MLTYVPGRGFVERAAALPPAAGTFVAWMLTDKTAREMRDWADFMGVVSLIPPEELHATIMYAPDQRLERDLHGDRPLPYPLALGRYNLPATRVLGKPGDPGALVTTFDSDRLAERHRYYRDVHGLTGTFPDYLPHISMSYDASAQRPEVMRRLMRCPCMMPISFDRERVADANPD